MPKRFPLGLCVDDSMTYAGPSPPGYSEALAALRSGDPSLVLEAALPPVFVERKPARCHDAELWLGLRSERWHVVIPVRGAHESLRRCLASLARLEDSDSFDVTLVCHRGEFDAVATIALDARNDSLSHLPIVVPTVEPCSFARNCNEGLEDYWPDSDVVVFLNSDCDVSGLVSLRGAFAVALGIADAVGPSGTNVSGFQAKQGPYYTASTSNLIRFPGSDRDPFPSLRERLGSCVGKVKPPTPRLVGFCLAVRLGAFRDVGGWDESFVNAFEDDDLSLRLALRSTPGCPSLLWVPSALVEHEGQASFRELPDAEDNYVRTLEENRKRFEDRWAWALPAIRKWWALT